jgi:hypothetical protein
MLGFPDQEAPVRMMMKAQMSTEAGNEAIREGRLPVVIGEVIERLKPEATYFIAEGGMRTAVMVFEMDESSDIPYAAEPLFMQLGAEVTFSPAMNLDEMRAGVAKAQEAAAG